MSADAHDANAGFDANERGAEMKDTPENRAGDTGENLQSTDDLTLLRRSAEGDQTAFSVYFRRKRSRIFRLAARICGPNEADDVTQVVFLRLWKVLPALEDLSKADAWLARTTTNRAIDHLRHIGRKLRIVLDEKHMNVQDRCEQSLNRGELAAVFDRAAERLGERQRLAFVLRELEGYSSDETAQMMGIAASTVRNLVMQARAGLRTALRKLFPEYVPGDVGEAERNER